MDTPKRNENQQQQQQQQSGTPTASSIEDSPVFIFINSLSPIKPVRPVHIAQTIHAVSFPSIPSIFTSPHINTKKDSKLLARYPLSDLSSKSDYLDGDVAQNDPFEGAENAVKHSNQVDNRQEEGNLVCSLNEANNSPVENSMLPTPQPESFHYDCGSPSHNLSSFDANSGTKYVMGSTSLIEFVHDGLEKKSQLPEFEFRNSLTNEQQSELKEHDWETAIFEGEEDLLFLDSSDLQASGSQFENYIDHGICCSSLSSRFSQNTIDNIPTTHMDTSFPQKISNELVVSHTREFTEKNLPGHTPHLLSACSYQPVVSNPTEKIYDGSGGCNTSDGMVDFQKQRGARRRCLTFEMAENRRRNFPTDSNRVVIASLPHPEQFAVDSNQAASSKPVIGILSCSLPTIGLHLNSLTSTPKGRVLEDSLFSAKTLGTSVSSHPSHPCGMRNVDDSESMEKSPESDVENLLVVQDSAQVPDVLKSDDINHSSPKKKKRRAENSSDGEPTCRRCNCKKSKCLKLYCECFAAGVYCVEPCSCQGCLNTSQHEDTVLATRKQIESRNPLAFAPKVIMASEPAPEVGEDTNKTPASARHKRGCNCKKSSCLKKYCECYQGGAGCSISCRCEGCKNTFGRKDGTVAMEIDEIDPEERHQERHEADTEKMDNQQFASVQNEQKHFSETLAITPFQISRRCFKLPSTSTGKPPRHSSSVAAIGSNMLITSKILVQSNKARTEDATSELRQGNTSPISGVKVVSPSRKRISPPRSEGGLSPSHKGCRKLILKSIPSFPSLTGESSDELHPSSSPSTFNP